MGLDDLPEVKLARRILRKHALEIPFDLDQLVRRYANLIYKKIEIEGVDGVSVNLKTPGKRPTIIVDETLSAPRRAFTLAHELGHIIIPWHVGTIADETNRDLNGDFIYATIEQEANRFAAELLMPKAWVLDLFEVYRDQLAILHQQIVAMTGASNQAAAIRMVEVLPPNILFVLEENGVVSKSGRTNHTGAIPPKIGSPIKDVSYSYLKHTDIAVFGPKSYHWFEINSSVEISIEGEQRSWRRILDDILTAVMPEAEVATTKMSINGILASANGQLKHHAGYSVDLLVSVSIQKLMRKGLESVVSHPDFEKFVKIRAQDFFK